MVVEESQDRMVTIERDGDLCTVKPGVLVVCPNDNIIFQNQTADSISILFSEEEISEKYRFAVDSKANTPMPIQSVRTCVYPYAVFCREIDDFAQASSMPKIIVRPK